MQEEISFGVWLRKQRRALDLSRQAFADQVGCAEVTLRRIEAGTLKPSKELASVMLEKLGILETKLPQWISFARGISGLPSQTIPQAKKPITNLPAPLTSFIGREKEQSEVIQLITKHRLVTLTGSGGVGKTRLSIKVGEQVLDNYDDDVWLVELAPILDPFLVPRTTAIAIGLRDEPQRPVIDMLSDYLCEKKTVIILDNCEHLLDACAQLVETLLKRCPGLQILATSREVLGILGEATYRVPSLELPDLQQSLEDQRPYESARLFEERAQLADMNFSITMENAATVAKICAHLDGIPLAIELAAARVGTLSTELIEERLRENFRLLTGGNRTALPRHQTLEAAIDWSYNLLSPAEQILFRRLSVFIDGWTVDAAVVVCSDDSLSSEVILELLTQLINKSLVAAQEGHGRPRYRMLETLRQYASEKLTEAGEREMLRDRHLEYFLNLAETAEPHLIRTEQIDWLPLLDGDYENLRLALEWGLSKESTEPALSLCRALWWYWVIRFYWLEGLNWVKRALAKPYHNESTNAKVARARALSIYADLEWQLSNFKQMLPFAEASLSLALEVSDRKDIAIARFYVGGTLGITLREDINRALSMLEQSFAEFEALDEPFWQALSFNILGSLLAKEGKLKYREKSWKGLTLAHQAGERLLLSALLSDYADVLLCSNQVDRAREQIEESNKLYKQVGLKNNIANSLILAEIAWIEGNHEKAISLYVEIYKHFSLLGSNLLPALSMSRLGILAREDGDLERARQYFETALRLIREVGYKPDLALCLVELSNLAYLQGNLEEFKEKFRESLSQKNYFAEVHKLKILITILGSLYFQEPESSARLLGVIDNYEKKDFNQYTPIDKRYCGPAKTYARKALGSAFKSAFAEGQKMSLDDALDLALKTVEEM